MTCPQCNKHHDEFRNDELCIIEEKASRKEFMKFLNWLAKKPYYEKIVAEYIVKEAKG